MRREGTETRRGRRAAPPIVAAALLAAALLAGCTGLEWIEPAAPTWVEVRGVRNLHPPIAPVRRVLVLPFDVGDALPVQAEALRAAISQALRDACGLEVVAPALADLPRSTRDELEGGGARDFRSLIRLHREWTADAALFGRLAFGRANGEPAVGLELELLDTRDGSRLWSAKDTVDAREPRTRAALLSWRRVETGHDEDAPNATQVPLDSFAGFVAHSFVRTLFRAAAEVPRAIAKVPGEKPAQAPHGSSE
jgi:hypothetical protein